MTSRMPTEFSGCTRPTPAGYSSTDAAEVEALNVFRAALDPNRIKADLKERDKHPNTDGYLELVDDHGIPVGKLEVQVRKIPAGATKYQCPTSLFAYTNSTALPLLLICVDPANGIVYWKHLKYENILGKETQNSVSSLLKTRRTSFLALAHVTRGGYRSHGTTVNESAGMMPCNRLRAAPRH